MSQLPNPGDLAWIAREGPGREENIGAVVHVLRDQTPNADEFARFGPLTGEVVFVCEVRELLAFNGKTGRVGRAPKGTRLWVDRTWLRRIGGPSADAEAFSTTEEPSPVSA